MGVGALAVAVAVTVVVVTLWPLRFFFVSLAPPVFSIVRVIVVRFVRAVALAAEL